jgi:S-adenosylmethionine-diacylgycerolhomoserine-N-methlytransferase
MAPSTSPVSSGPDLEGFGLAGLRDFYRFHAAVYDWTRPFILFGREEAVHRLRLEPGQLVIDVGCGTGFSLPALAASGATVVAVEPSEPMRQRARARLQRHGLADEVCLDPEPYGSHERFRGRADAILFSYSLSMIPPYRQVLDQAWHDLRPGGRLVVVDFLDAWGPVGGALRASHVFLGPARLERLSTLFTHKVRRRHALLWRWFLFVGRRD